MKSEPLPRFPDPSLSEQNPPQEEWDEAAQPDILTKPFHEKPEVPTEDSGVRSNPSREVYTKDLDDKLERLMKVAEAEELNPEDVVDEEPEIEEIEDVEIIPLEEDVAELQNQDVVEEFEIQNFQGLEITATLEKKNERKGDPDNKNEDCIVIDRETGLIGVCDGLGGEGEKGAGAKASAEAARAIPLAYAEQLQSAVPLSDTDLKGALVELQLLKKNPVDAQARIKFANVLEPEMGKIVQKDRELAEKALALLEAVRQSNEAVKQTGGQTTVTVGLVHTTPDGENWAVLASVGDSPAMKRRSNGELLPITKEDSLLNLAVDAEIITPRELAKLQIDPKYRVKIPLWFVKQYGVGQKAELEALERQGVTDLPADYKLLKRAMVASLGSSISEPSLNIRRLDPGDELILASDGVTDKYELENGLTNFDEMGAVFNADGLDAVREAAKRKESAAKKDDDIAIVRVKPIVKEANARAA